MKTKVAEEVYEFLENACAILNSIYDDPNTWNIKTEKEQKEIQQRFNTERFYEYRGTLKGELEENMEECGKNDIWDSDLICLYINNYYGQFLLLGDKLQKPSSRLVSMGEGIHFVWFLWKNIGALINGAISVAEEIVNKLEQDVGVDIDQRSNYRLEDSIRIEIGEHIRDANERSAYYSALYSRFQKENKYERLAAVDAKLSMCPKEEMEQKDGCKIRLSDDIQKVDIIRVFIALFELGWFVREDGKRVFQNELFRELGRVFKRDDIIDYARNWSQVVSNGTTDEANRKIFDDMINALFERIYKKEKS